ncbi:ATP-binding protein [Streptomyces sp. V4I2]|uniref:ATP-binding protein n=1 Tax=Streptomyces sp. V4I2 TaxID=3042280 RepID=UPI002784ACF4|nr:ATP-binding protein [Streptomyces sp. V4I2]MDQ1047853.1 anti-sigma regulatory factor (Ser/Thr protein kinase) [Streptomyces sp. V4I2]
MDTASTPFDATPTRVGWDASVLDPYRPVAEARHRTRIWLQQHWKLGELVDPVELAVGELCTNAVRHGGGLAGLELVLAAGRQFAPALLRVMVIDHAPERVPEVPADADLFGEGGRGLRLVEALARRWGWHRTGFDEKQVWCTFAVASGAVLAGSADPCHPRTR